MATTNLPTNINPGVTDTFEADVETAWKAINDLTRETGLRNVTSYLVNGWTAASVQIERIRDRVYLYVKGLNGASATSSRWMDFSGAGIGTGFAPADVTEGPALRTGSTYDARITVSLSGGFSSPTGFDLGTGSVREMSWRCVASWPSPLPGSAA